MTNISYAQYQRLLQANSQLKARVRAQNSQIGQFNNNSNNNALMMQLFPALIGQQSAQGAYEVEKLRIRQQGTFGWIAGGLGLVALISLLFNRKKNSDNVNATVNGNTGTGTGNRTGGAGGVTGGGNTTTTTLSKAELKEQKIEAIETKIADLRGELDATSTELAGLTITADNTKALDKKKKLEDKIVELKKKLDDAEAALKKAQDELEEAKSLEELEAIERKLKGIETEVKQTKVN